MKYLSLALATFLLFLVLVPIGQANTIGEGAVNEDVWDGFDNLFPGGGSPGSGGTDTLGGILRMISTTILNPLVVFLMGISVVVFIWGMVRYLSKAGDDNERQKARQYIVWGIVSLFVMVSVWGFVNILVNSFFPSGLPSAPSLPSF